ncbi:hypothetical protein RVBP14_1780 [Pseudomonas phage sp. Brmt]|nr:hypothetical protein RVBP14_1780 [Pseudomonas phage sp. Brmt]
MPSIVPSQVPGPVALNSKVKFNFSSDIQKVYYTVSPELPPVLSEYIAYDGDPATGGSPFIAVVQDGTGNVLYDCSFPKFYNLNYDTYQIPANTTNPQDLWGWVRYFYNAIGFIRNGSKYESTGKKFLVITDSNPSEPYSVLNTSGNGFKKILDTAARVQDSTYDVYYPEMMGGTVDLTLTDLNKYYACILFSTKDHNTGALTPERVSQATIDNLATWRKSGNGIFVITDSASRDYTNIEDAKENNGSFAFTANRLAFNFGSYFSGVVDRSDVQYTVNQMLSWSPKAASSGLFTGMNKSIGNGQVTDFVIKGDSSESEIKLVTFPAYNKEDIPEFTFDHTGEYIYNFLCTTSENPNKPYAISFRFQVGVDDGIFVARDNGQAIDTTQILTAKRYFDLNLGYSNGTDHQDYLGDIQINGYLVGSFLFSQGITQWDLITHGSTLLIHDNDQIRINVRVPYTYTMQHQVVLSSKPASLYNEASLIGTMAWDDYKGISKAKIYEYINLSMTKYMYRVANAYKNSINIKPIVLTALRRTFLGETLNTANVYVYDNNSTWGKLSQRVQNGRHGDIVIFADTSKVVQYDELASTPGWYVMKDPGLADVTVAKLVPFFGNNRAIKNRLKTGDILDETTGQPISFHANWKIENDKLVKV